MDALVVGLLAWIATTAGYDGRNLPPKVSFVTSQFIRDAICDGRNCPVLGMYLYGDTLYLDERLDVEHDVTHRAVLLHELVHYVQVRSGKYPRRDCETWLAQEREAYALQSRWLARQGIWLLHPRAGPGAGACREQG